MEENGQDRDTLDFCQDRDAYYTAARYIWLHCYTLLK